ncbi:hypothetical protein QQ056_07050 [Oscillatoria laete-virens NRMC-F 0139]|nr:hypothetical protein [Oscillatoria laete-virens]MDL5053301.1 hypothetical protein [Oscillatoria laete-virens NRMC-F 0139]
MTTRDDIYHKFGITAEAAQLLEVELETILMACYGLKKELWKEEKKLEANEIYRKIDKSTLGMIITQVKQNVSIKEDTETKLTEALNIRNKLFHSFYLNHNLKIEDQEGRDKMLKDLEEMHEKLFQAYQISQAMAEAMTQLVMKVASKNF